MGEIKTYPPYTYRFPFLSNTIFSPVCKVVIISPTPPPLEMRTLNSTPC